MTLKNNLMSVIETLKVHQYPITSVFDIGANKGRWTVRYDKVLPNAKFYMFEANPHRTKPGIVNKHAWFNAVLSSPDKKSVEFYDRMGTGDSYYKEDTKFYDGVEPTKLDTITLDEIVAKHELPQPQIVKLDTQGSELDILNGATKTLKHVDIIQIETPILAYNQGAPGFMDYVSYMITQGFVPVGLDEIHISDNILMQLDIIFLRKEIKDKYYESVGFWRGLGK